MKRQGLLIVLLFGCVTSLYGQSTGALLRDLHSPKKALVRQSIHQLTQKLQKSIQTGGDPSSFFSTISDVAPLLGHSNGKIAEMAIEYLKLLGPDSLPSILPLVLKKGKPRLQKNASRVLGAMGRPAFEALFERLKQKDHQLKTARVLDIMAGFQIFAQNPKAFQNLLQPLIAGVASPSRSFSLHCRRALYKMGSPALGAILSYVASLPVLQQGPLANVVSAMGSKVVPQLQKALKSPQKRVRIFASRSLYKMGDVARNAVDDLISALKDRESKVRYFSAQGLVNIGKLAVPPLTKQLPGANPSLQREILLVLGALGSQGRSATPQIRGLLKNPSLRNTAVNTLGKIGPSAASSLPQLILLFGNAPSPLKNKILQAILKIGPPTGKPKVLKKLQDLLESKKPEVRNLSVRMIGSAGKEAIPLLLPLLSSRKISVQQLGFSGLLALGPRAIPTVVSLLKSSDGSLKDGALQTLRAMGNQASSALPALIGHLAKATPLLAKKITTTINILLPAKEAELESLVPLSFSPHGLVSRYAQKAILSLSKISIQKTLILTHLLKSKSLAPFARTHLIDLGKKETSSFVNLYLRANREEAEQMALVCSQMGVFYVNQLIQRVLRAKEVSDSLLISLGKVGALGLPRLAKIWESHQSRLMAHRISLVTGHIGTEGVSLALVLFFHPSFEKEGARALVEIGEPAILPLESYLLDIDEVFWASLVGWSSPLGQMDGGEIWRHLYKKKTKKMKAIFQVFTKIKKPAIPYLIELLAERKPLQTLSAQSLRKIGKPAIPALIQALAPPRYERNRPLSKARELYFDSIREGVSKILTRMGPSAILPLIQSLSNKNESLRNRSAAVLVSLGDQTIPFLRTTLEGTNMVAQSMAAKVLGDLGPRAHQTVPDLIRVLKASDLQVRTYAREALLKMGYHSVAPLVVLLKDKKTKKALRELVIEILGELGKQAKGGVDPIIEELKSADTESMKMTCVEALAKIGTSSQKVIPLLIHLLPRAQSETLIISILKSLGSLRAKEAIPLLITYKVSPSFYVRRRASQSINSLLPPTSKEIPQLVKLLGHSNIFVRYFAGEILEKMGSEASDGLIAVLGERKAAREAIKILARLKSKATFSLLAAVKDGDLPLNMRKRALTALGLSRVHRGFYPLLKIYPKLPKTLQKLGQIALIRLDKAAPQDAVGLAKLFFSPNPWVRHQAIQAMDKIKTPPSRSAKALIKAIEKAPDPEGKKSAQAGLARIGKRSLSPIKKILFPTGKKTFSLPFQKAMIEVLGQIGTAGIPLLLRTLEKKSYSQSAQLALSQMKSQAVGPLLRYLKKNHYLEVGVVALAKVGKPALDPLFKAMEKDGEGPPKVLAKMDSLGPLVKKIPSSSPAFQRGAIHTLLLLGKKGHKVLLKLWGRDSQISSQISIEIKKRKPLEFLICGLASKKERIRFQSADLLATIPQSLPHLTLALGKKEFKRGAREAIKRMGTPAIDLLSKDLKAQDSAQRLASALALYNIGRPAWRATSSLIEALEDSDKEVALAAGRALEAIGEPAAKELAKAYQKNPQLKKQILSLLSKMGSSKGVVVLLEGLKSPSVAIRLKSLVGLSRVKKKNATILQAFLGALQDKNSSIRLEAVRALGAMGSFANQASPALIKMLADPVYSVSQTAGTALARLGLPSSKAIPLLVKLLDHPEVKVRKNALALLVKMGKPSLGYVKKPLQDGSIRIRTTILELLGKFPPQKDFLPSLIGQFPLASPTLRQYACQQVSRFGSQGVPVLLKALQSEKELVRECAILTMGLLGDRASSATSALLARLDDGKEYQNFLIRKTLVKIGPAVLTDLAPLLFHKKFKMRYLAVQVIEKLGKSAQSVVPQLKRVLAKEEEPEIRQSAVLALGKIGLSNYRAIPVLLQALDDQDSSVSDSAKKGLRGLSNVSPRILGPLKRGKFLDHSKSIVRQFTCLVLGKTRSKKATPFLIKKLNDTSAPVVLTAGLALAQTGLAHRSELVKILEFLSRGTTALRINLLQAIQKSSLSMDYSALGALRNLLNDPSMELRIGAVKLLGKGGAKALPLFKIALEDPSEKVRLGALEGLGKAGSAGLPLLRKYHLSQNRVIRKRAVIGLMEVGKPALGDLVWELASPQVGEKIKNLFVKFPTQSLKVLEKFLLHQSPSVPALDRSVEILIQLGPPSLPILTKCLKKTGAISSRVLAKMETAFLPIQKAQNLESQVAGLKKQLSRLDLTEMEKDVLRKKLAKYKKQLGQLIKKLEQRGLGKTYIDQTSRALVGLFLSPKEEVYRRAQKLLRILGRRAVPALIQGGREKPPYISSKVLWEQFIVLRKKLHRRVIEELSFQGLEALPFLLKAFSSKDDTLKRISLMAILQMENIPPQSIPLLMQALDSPSMEVRRYAAEVLNKLGAKARPYLIKALNSPQRRSQSSAALALGKMGKTAGPAIPALLKRLRGPKEVALASARALKNIGIPQAKEGKKLIQALDSPYAEVRQYGVYALSILSSAIPNSASALVKLLGDENREVRSGSALALVKMGKPAVKALTPLLSHGSQGVKKQVIFILGRMGKDGQSALSSLIPLLKSKSPEIQNLTQQCLEAITGKYFETPAQWKAWAKQRESLSRVKKKQP